jgi:hypothetical protein
METQGVRVVSLDCPGCGASLQIGPSLSQLACGYCGKVATVERTGGTIALLPMVAAIERVQLGTDKTAAELAMARLSREIAKAEEFASQMEAFSKEHAKSHPENLKRQGTSKEEVIAGILASKRSHHARINRMEAEYERHRAIAEGRVPPAGPAATVADWPQAWYYLQKGQTIGPLTDEEFARAIALKKVSAEALIWNPGFEGWIKFVVWY